MSEPTLETNEEWIPDEPMFRDYVGTDKDTGRQVLVTIWQNGVITVAQRQDKWATWEPSIKVVEQ